MNLYPTIELRQQQLENSVPADLSLQLTQLTQLGFDTVYIVDRDAQYQGRAVNLPLITSLIKQAAVPVWVGGGIRALDTIAALLKAGATFIVVGPSLWQQAGLLSAATKMFPTKIIALIDAYNGVVVDTPYGAPKQHALDLALQFEKQGVAGIIYMEHEREGAGGFDAEIIADLAFALTVPLYVTGGIHALSDLRALKAEAHTGIKGVILGRALLDGRIDPITAKALLASREAELS